MIQNSLKVKINNKNTKYITQWIDENGNYYIDKYVKTGRVILNKDMTGCGFTTYCIKNSDNMIIVSPRVQLINNKMQQEGGCYYFNREVNKITSKPYFTEDALVNNFIIYRQQRGNKPLKLFVTYDSFYKLADMLEQIFHCNINEVFRIAIDESQCIVKDVKMKEYSNKSVLSRFINRLFRYDNLLFASATPITKYVMEIPEFKQSSISLVELEWAAKEPVIFKRYPCSSTMNAFNLIFDYYIKHDDGSGRHYFDALYMGQDKTYYSYEAVIFINCVDDVRKILSKYINKGWIDVNDVTIICADNKANEEKLRKANPKLRITTTIPSEGQPHTTWTFVTRTAFEGVDFYSSCASTYVVANYNVESLSLDIASDIPQIVGRQRLETNLFRNVLHIYLTNARTVPTKEEFEAFQQEKLYETQERISTYEQISGTHKQTYVNDMTKQIENDPNWSYLKTNNGILEINNLILVSERYCHDILNDHLQLYITKGIGIDKIEYHEPTVNFKEELTNSIDMTDYMRITYNYFTSYPETYQHDEFYWMLRIEGYNKVAYYLSSLSLDRICACGGDTWKMDQEITNGRTILSDAFRNQVATMFVVGKIYTRAEIKEMLQELFDNVGLNKTAKATLLPEYINCEECKKDGMKAYRIL